MQVSESKNVYLLLPFVKKMLKNIKFYNYGLYFAPMKGLNSAVAPLYLAKIAPISLRGFCVTCNQLSITFGILIGGILGMKLVLDTETLWPILVASPTIPAIYSLVTLTFCPESPKYLLVNKRDDDAAEAALIWLSKTSNVSEEMEAMKKEGQDLRNSPKVVYYSTSIFISAGLSKETSQYATLATGVVNVMMTFISALIMDRAGRRTLHMIGLVGTCISSVVLVVCLSLQKTLPWLSCCGCHHLQLSLCYWT
uniref:Major facilitator superfamily (MFS) profile domain-containing protein n=1 Tax=Biomphalaria glabrata TaxID=6526 RepID=A0A2C9LFI2_BIOGL